ncbi:copper transport protein ATOX1-like [Dreissena polymorpha]|uniref:copper transport protein ATOX1-like n=1 Tax=Dreissena polymorpha TaxID=45954 RepID=UPI002264DA3A|nr:copper transport protein ATOX1-like [Dreissena polymorpha]
MPAQTYEFKMEMTCEGCSGAAKRVLGKLGEKVSNIDADISSQKVTVTSELSADELLETLKKTGKTVSYIGVKK